MDIYNEDINKNFNDEVTNIEILTDEKISIDDEILTDDEIIDTNTGIVFNSIENYYKIPLRNIKREIIDYTLIDSDDYDRVIKYTWSIMVTKLVNKDYKKAQTKINCKNISLSHFIIGKPSNKKNVIDHINNNSLDNRKKNLREATRSQNSQNKKKIIKSTTTSKYIGVYLTKNLKWICTSSKQHLGTFHNEIDAAITYDKYVLIKYGKNASTNNLVKYDDILNLTLNDIIPPKIIRELPRNIFSVKNSFIVSINYNCIRYNKCLSNLEQALMQLELFKKEIEKIKIEENIIHMNKKITRNKNNQAIIYIKSSNNDTINYTIVNDENWHELSKISWCFNSLFYVSSTINGKNTQMHRYIMDATEDDEKVDHVNHLPYDNRKENLRFATDSLNAHNKIKKENTSSIYIGAVKRLDNTGEPYRGLIKKDGINYTLGQYDSEIKAAIAYNLKAVELYGSDANLNVFNIDESLYNEYKKEVLENWNKDKTPTSNYSGVYRSTNNLNPWKSKIFKDKITYSLGFYNNELKAALAYNMKALELNPNCTDLNTLNITEDIRKEYETEIYEKWKRKKTSKYHGVRMNKRDDKFTAQIYINKKNVYIGTYENELIAAIAYNIKAKEASLKYNKDFVINDITSLNIDENIYNLYVDEINEKLNEKLNKKKSSIYNGISLDKKKWNVHITIDGKKTYLGKYNNEIEAALVYNKKAIEIYGDEYKKINIIDDELYEKYKNEK